MRVGKLHVIARVLVSLSLLPRRVLSWFSAALSWPTTTPKAKLFGSGVSKEIEELKSGRLAGGVERHRPVGLCRGKQEHSFSWWEF